MDRTINVGSISAEQAISYGFTGPNLQQELIIEAAL
jgi:NADH-quinone oxidoreductase subunit D